MRFTDRSIAGLRAKKERYEVWEDGRTGFGIRVSPAGRRSWLFMYRFNGKPRRMTLGTYPQMPLAKANIALARAKELKAEGIDPGTVHIEAQEAERAAETVAELVEEYLARWARPNKRSAGEDERILRKDVLPAWGASKAKEITRKDVIRLLDSVNDRGSPIMANRTLAVVRKVFNFGVSRDILDATPVAMVQAPAREITRDRVLSPDEIRTFWNGLGKASMTEAVRIALKLELVTAQRKSEICEAWQSEFDLDGGLWKIPAERAKNGVAHIVPLSPLAVDLLREAVSLAGESAWLFPSPKNDRSIGPRAINYALRRAMTETETKDGKRPPAIGLEGVTPHDLRRTAATGMTTLGVSRIVLAKLLNHVEKSNNATAVYDRHSYLPEKTRALNGWADHLEDILTGKVLASNVVVLPLVASQE